MRLDPNFADAHGNLGQIRLLLGDFERGLPESEWRLAKVDGPPNVANPSRWDGSDLAGRTILLQAEQGSGDTLQFIRYVPLVKDRGGKVIVQCQASLLRLLASMVGIDQLVAQGSPLPAFAVRASILSLPYLFRTALDTIPAAVPYLQVDANLVARWRDELNANSSFTRPGFRIGILWQGNPTYGRDRERSIPWLSSSRWRAWRECNWLACKKAPASSNCGPLAASSPCLTWKTNWATTPNRCRASRPS